MNISESIKLALLSVKQNKLRAGLTLLSISIGIFTIISIGTVVSSLDNTVTGEMSALGENKIVIQKMPIIQMGPKTWRKYSKRKPINYNQAEDFKKLMTSTSRISVFSKSRGSELRYKNIETDPNVEIVGSDENFISLNKLDIDKGRNFSKEDIGFNQKGCILGNDLVLELFKDDNPIGKTIKIDNHKYTVIGTTEPRGSVMGQSLDNYAIIPITEFLKYFGEWWNESLSIEVEAQNQDELPYVMDEAIMVFRNLRNCKPWEENSFELVTNEAITEQFQGLTKYLTIFGAIIGFIALLAAGVGIMNIMLISVKERTREIGVRKAVGAKKKWILTQFIVEAITLCQLGGLIGIFFGSMFALIISKIGNLGFALPLFWVALSLVFCTLMGLFFGAYPAWKAAKLDPIEALRYE